MFNLVDVDQAVATLFIGMIVGIVIAGLVMAYFARKR